VFELHVQLSDVEPAVWRRIRMSSGAPLVRAARVFAVAMGWTPGRPYAFTAGPLRYEGRQVGGTWEDVVDVRLRQLLPDTGAELEFEYGNGHVWHLLVRLDRVLPPNAARRPPLCVAGSGSAPPVDMEGPWAYEEWRRTEGFAELTDKNVTSGHRTVIPRFNADVVNAELERLK
jgi:hypothetical protein